MRGTVVTACGVIAALLLVGPAWSETKTIRASGAWQVFGGTTSKGGAICGVSTDVNGQYFGLKVVAGQAQTMAIHVGGKGFPVAKDQRTAMRMQIDELAPRNSTGRGLKFDDGDPAIEWTLTGAEGGNFFAELLAGSMLRISLPDIGMPDWTFSLAGTGVLGPEFQQCVETLR